MGSKVSPVSCRLGFAFDWLIDSTINKRYLDREVKNEELIAYIAEVFSTKRAIYFGFIFSAVKIKVLKEFIILEISVYISTSFVYKLKERLSFMERHIIKATFSLYKKPVKVIYYISGNFNISASSIVTFMYLRIRRGVFVNEVFRELRYFLKTYYKKKFFLGYKILCKGRFSRRQRAGKRVLEKGPLPVQNYSRIMDMSQRSVVMKYGVSNLKVWLFKREHHYQYGIVCVV